MQLILMFNYKPLACIPSFCMINKCYISPCLPPVYFTMFDTDTSAYLTVHFCHYTPPCISLTAPSPPLAPVYLSLPPSPWPLYISHCPPWPLYISHCPLPPGPCISLTAPPGPCISLTAPLPHDPCISLSLHPPPPPGPCISFTAPLRRLYISHCPPGPCISLTALLRLLYISHCPLPPTPVYLSLPHPRPMYISHCTLQHVFHLHITETTH